jgi:hypothetical protein
MTILGINLKFVIIIGYIDAPMHMLVGDCPPIGNVFPYVLARWQQIQTWIGKLT